ncbi:hypothetical protein SE91_06550 [Bradyrhizobium sp. DOA1]|nr:hypothetical protein SE91_06550 [Bradyrhizobium sp. DOA1]
MRDTRHNVISLTDINVHGVARIVSFDDGRAFKNKENIAYLSMPVPGDTFVTNKTHSRNPKVRTNRYMLQAISALARRPKIIPGIHCCSPLLWFSSFPFTFRPQLAKPSAIADYPKMSQPG